MCRSSNISTSALASHDCMERDPVPPRTSASCSRHPSSSPLQGNLLLLPVRLLQVIFWKHYGVSPYLGWTNPSYEDRFKVCGLELDEEAHVQSEGGGTFDLRNLLRYSARSRHTVEFLPF